MPSNYGEGKEPLPAIDFPTVIIMINQRWKQGLHSSEDIYDATRRSWHIHEDTRAQVVYVLGVANGVVRGAYRAHSWHPVEDRRWEFEGVPAPELNAVGKSVERLKARQGASNPVRKYLGGIQAPTSESK